PVQACGRQLVKSTPSLYKLLSFVKTFFEQARTQRTKICEIAQAEPARFQPDSCKNGRIFTASSLQDSRSSFGAKCIKHEQYTAVLDSGIYRGFRVIPK